MTEARLNLVSPTRRVPASFDGMSLAEAGREWFRAGWEIHPATPSGVKIETAFAQPPRSEQEVMAVLQRMEMQTPNMRLGVVLPDDVIVIRVRSGRIERGEGVFRQTQTTDWRDSFAKLRSAFDPDTVLATCPCHRFCRGDDVHLWLTIPDWAERPDYIGMGGPEGTWVLLGEAFVHVPPSGRGTENTRANWMHPPSSREWLIPPCPDDLWTAISSRAADTAADDCGM